MNFVGGIRHSFLYAGVSRFNRDHYGLLVGLGSDGSPRLASDCYPAVGIFLGHDATYDLRYDLVQLGVTKFWTRFFKDDLVIGQPVYAHNGYVVANGVYKIGILISIGEGMVEVLFRG
jgi:hypothetical protein